MNSFAASIKKELISFRKGDVRLVSESREEVDFGNAEAIFVLDEVRLRFVDDRGLKTVEIGLPAGETIAGGGADEWPLETLAVALDWIGMDDLLGHYRLTGIGASTIYAEEPPPGPFYELTDALAVLKDRWGDVLEARNSPEIRKRADYIRKQLEWHWEMSLMS
jgi:hypothetical protein